jgi:DHA2 family methylenomycin A resistance protein-like MFS transporter
MVIGLATGAIGLAALAASVDQASYALLASPLALLGFGMAFVMPAVTTTVVEAAPPSRPASPPASSAPPARSAA